MQKCNQNYMGKCDFDFLNKDFREIKCFSARSKTLMKIIIFALLIILIVINYYIISIVIKIL